MHKTLSLKMNLILQKEYLIASSNDSHPYLGTESVRGCYAVLIHHPQRSAILHWDDNCNRISFNAFIEKFLDHNILLSECSVALVGGWLDHEESKKNGDFLRNYFEKTCKKLDLSNFQIKKSKGSAEKTGFSLVYLDTTTGNIVADANWQNYSPNDEKYRGQDTEKRYINFGMLDLTHLQDEHDEKSGTRIYARDQFNDIQHKESSLLCTAAQKNDIAQLIKLIDEGITHVNVSPKNTKGWTPLHFACKLGNIDAALLLIQNGGDLLQKNDARNAPIDFLTKDSFEYKKLLTAYQLIRNSRLHNPLALRSFSLFSRHKEMFKSHELETLLMIENKLKTEQGISEITEIFHL